MTTTQILAKEGIKGGLVLLVLFLLAVAAGSEFFIILFLLALGFWLFMFRNPERLPSERLPNALMAPCDGVIENIEYASDAILVTLKIGLLDVGVLRAPFVMQNPSFQKQEGLSVYLASDEKKEALNARYGLKVEDFEMMITPELFGAKIYGLGSFCTGERIGFCKVGRLRLQLKPNFVELKVNIGDILKSGETLLGYVR